MHWHTECRTRKTLIAIPPKPPIFKQQHTGREKIYKPLKAMMPLRLKEEKKEGKEKSYYFTHPA